jgi:Effector protein
MPGPVLWDQGHPGIYIIDDKPNFFHLCSTALNRIRSQPVGAGLIKTISAKCLMSDLKLYINDCSTSSTEPRQWRSACAYEATTGGDGKPYVVPGQGSTTSVGWYPSDEHPEGNRPAFIGLAHELIHALYNLHGLIIRDPADVTLDNKYGMPQGVTVGKAVDEARVTGLGRFASLPFTENAIRREHGVADRLGYVVNGHNLANVDVVKNSSTPLPSYVGEAQLPL